MQDCEIFAGTCERRVEFVSLMKFRSALDASVLTGGHSSFKMVISSHLCNFWKLLSLFVF
jgi:hypothetical protein